MKPNIIWNTTKYTGDGETYQSDVRQPPLSFHESLSFLSSAADPRVQGVRPVRVCLVAERVDIQAEDSSGLRGRAADACLADLLVVTGRVVDLLVVTGRVVDLLVVTGRVVDLLVVTGRIVDLLVLLGRLVDFFFCMKSGISLLKPVVMKGS